ncbi:MAG TPA: M20/M25/M40 family metallo-hydrolase [Lacunisphaera sp.]|nr:M20/M25/M40 family metallo-hydrolase [Lacunisphaera sp.]
MHPAQRLSRLLLVLALFPAAVGPACAAITADEQRIVAAVDALQARFPRDLEQAVAIDSATENLAGVRQLGLLFADQLRELGFEARFVELPASTGRAGHLVAEHRGSKGKRILLIGHLDTVYPGANFRREGDIAHGAGTGDMKGGDVVILHALRALHDAGELADARIIVIMTGDEEAPGHPLEVVRRELTDAARRSDVALAFESAVGMTGTVARRGSISWLLEVQGETGHSSGMFSDETGSGSVYEMARILSGFHAELRQLDGVTCNPALVAGGADGELTRTGGKVAGKTNIIPQRTLVRGDLRVTSPGQLAEAERRMQAIVSQHNLPHTAATLTFDEGYPPMPPTPANYALLGKLDQVSRDLGFGAITAFDPRGRGAGDIAFVSPPLPGLDGLGLGGKGEHTRNESTDLSAAPGLVKRAAVLIHRLARESVP